MNAPSPPQPTEATLTNLIDQVVSFRDGSRITMRLSEWHWAMVEFIDRNPESLGWKDCSFIYDMLMLGGIENERQFSNVVMATLRIFYEEIKLKIAEKIV